MEAQKFTLMVLAIGLCLVSVFESVEAAAENITCQDAIKELGKRQVSGVAACTKELNFKNSKEKKERANCILKCIMIRERVLNSEGKFDMKIIEQMIEENMPPNLTHLREKGEAMFMNCKDKHEANLDNNERSCKTYGPLIKCLMGMMSLCKD